MPKKEVETKKETKPKAKKTAVKKAETKEVKKEVKAPAKKTAETKTTKKAATKKPVVKKNAAKKEKEPANSIEKILTPANSENVILYNDKNEPMEFEQIALIPYKENLYCILRPVQLLDGMDQDEAISFLIQEENGNVWLDVVDDEETIDNIFDIYYELFEEAQKQTK